MEIPWVFSTATPRGVKGLRESSGPQNIKPRNRFNFAAKIAESPIGHAPQVYLGAHKLGPSSWLGVPGNTVPKGRKRRKEKGVVNFRIPGSRGGKKKKNRADRMSVLGKVDSRREKGKE